MCGAIFRWNVNSLFWPVYCWNPATLRLRHCRFSFNSLKIVYFLKISVFVFSMNTSPFLYSLPSKICGDYWEESTFKMPVATSSSDSGKLLDLLTIKAALCECVCVKERRRNSKRYWMVCGYPWTQDIYLICWLLIWLNELANGEPKLQLRSVMPYMINFSIVSGSFQIQTFASICHKLCFILEISLFNQSN